MKHVMDVIAREGAYSLEFSVDARCRILSVSFWGGTQLVCMPIAFCGRDMPLSRSFVVHTSQMLGNVGVMLLSIVLVAPILISSKFW